MLPRFIPVAVLGLLTISAVSVLSLAAAGSGRSLDDAVDGATAGRRFNLLEFEVQHVLAKALGEVGTWLTGRESAGPVADVALARYFDLGARLAARGPDDAPGAETIRAERRALENRVERTLEAQIGAALRSAGFTRSLPLFDGQALLWPPVDVELREPPRVLAVSRRSEIRLLRTALLDADLSIAEVTAIEAAVEADADGQFSAFVDRIGGLAAYPAIVRDTRSYDATVSTIAHEWAHHYLFFYPLGAAFYDTQEARSINETVADIVGDEIARIVLVGAALPAPPAPLPLPTFSESDEILRQLRLDVDALLAAGKVEEAEALMESVRLDLADRGRVLRRINQAFFAFNGVYGSRPETSSPIGPLVQDLRARHDSLQDFILQVRDVTTLAELQALVAAAPTN